MSRTILIRDEEHYDKVITKIRDVQHTLWIGTADIKDLYVRNARGTKPLLGILAERAEAGVEIRLLHAKEPGPAFREDFDRYPQLIGDMERALCPRVHFKIIVFDCKSVYIGSANLTGAGLGMKSGNTRNFETGILTDEPDLVRGAMKQFDEVWMGQFCIKCKRKEVCPDPIVKNTD